jgi:MYXO-CTERM domain-containing protein
LRSVSALALALLATPTLAAAGSPWDWRAYPNGEHQVAFDLAPDHLLVAFTHGAPPAGWERVVAKAAPSAVVVELAPLLKGRYRLHLGGTTPESLRAIADALVQSGAASAVWPALQRSTGVAFTDDQVAVRFDGVPPVAAMAKLGIRLVEATPIPGVWRAAAADGDAIGAAWALARRPEVRWAEPDLIRHVKPLAVPNDPNLAQQWHLETDDGRGNIDAEHAWDRTFGDPHTLVGIFDTGFQLDHPDLVPNIAGGFDASDNDDTPASECSTSQDGLGPSPNCPANRPFRESHGTSVAGLAAARADNGILGSGVCPLCSLYLVRLLGDGGGLRSLSNAVAFRRAADAGVSVINNSWGPSLTRFFPLAQSERETFDYITTQSRDGKGVVLVFAAGNDYFTPANSNPYASNAGVITVAASTRKDDFACYSDYGDVVAVAAPSEGCFDGEPGIYTTDYAGPEGYGATDFTGAFGGTSAASPIVTGTAALILSANPNLTAQQVRIILEASADKIVADKNPWMAQFGLDLVHEFAYDDHGFSKGFGYGRINAANAVAMAQDAPPLALSVCDEHCPRCVNDRCAPDCATDADCPGASRCLPTPDGAMGCQLPTRSATAPGEPCSPDCERCVNTVDSEFSRANICTKNCASDDDCPFGFDCRTIDARSSKACVPGNAECGTPWGDQRCQSQVRVQAGGADFCSCDCIPGDPAACPDGFTCAFVQCQQDRDGLFCQAVDQEFQSNYNPQCVPDPNYRRPCHEHTDCPVGMFCQNRVCGPDHAPGGCDVCAGCQDDGDCRDGETCVDLPRGKFCLAPCGADGSCPGDTECADVSGPTGNMCVNPDWRRKGYCPHAYRCEVEGRCFSAADCEGGASCTDHTCAAPAEPDAAPVDAAPADAAPADATPVADAGAVDAAVADAAAPDADDNEHPKHSDGGCAVGGEETSLPLLGLALLGVLRRRRR